MDAGEKGACSSKEAFLFLNNDMQVEILQQGARGISPQALNILIRVWRHKLIPPCTKTFTWRLIRRALAIGQRAGNLSSKIQKECSVYNMTENDSHLFFHCSFARAVWFSGTSPLITSQLPQEQDGVQEILSAIITPETTYDELQRILTILWYIWKARNDARFNNKKWSILQVHFAVAADMKLTIPEANGNMDENHQNLEDAVRPNTSTSGANRVQGMLEHWMADVCRTNDQSLNHTQQDTILSFAGNAEDGRAQNGNQMMCLPGPPHYKALLPAILPGTRCYADASTAPDITLQVSRSAGLGIFIVNGHTSTTSTIYVKAVMGSCNIVIMAEAAALALGAQILKALNVQQPFFLSDNQQLVTFFNGDHINPPYWDIKPFT